MAVDEIQQELDKLDSKSPFDLLLLSESNLSDEAQIALLCKIAQLDAVEGVHWVAQFQSGEVSPQELLDQTVGLIRNQFEAREAARRQEIKTILDRYRAQLQQNNLDPAIRIEITSRLKIAQVAHPDL